MTRVLMGDFSALHRLGFEDILRVDGIELVETAGADVVGPAGRGAARRHRPRSRPAATPSTSSSGSCTSSRRSRSSPARRPADDARLPAAALRRVLHNRSRSRAADQRDPGLTHRGVVPVAASYGAPGVYIEEQPSGSMPIEGVGTAIAAFVGFTEKLRRRRGRPDRPGRREAAAGHQLAAVRAGLRRLRARRDAAARRARLLRERRQRRYIVRIPSTGRRRRTADATLTLPAADRPEVESLQHLGAEPRPAHRGRGRPAAACGRRPRATAREQRRQRQDYTLRVYEDGALREEIGGLQFSGKSPRTLEKLGQRAVQVRAHRGPAGAGRLARRTGARRRPLPAGDAAPVTVAVTPADLEGSARDRTGYQGLAIAENVTMVAIPDLVTVATGDDGTRRRGDLPRRAEAAHRLVRGQPHTDGDPRHRRPASTPPARWSGARGSARDSAFAALYYPNVVVSNPLARPGATNGELFLTVPPSGPRRRRVGPDRRAPAACGRPRPTRRCAASSGSRTT